MHIYFSGLGGVGIGPLAEIAEGAGYEVSGSDLADSLMTSQLKDRGVDVRIGQDGSQIAETHARSPIDWLVHTAALPTDHPELKFAREHNIRTSKRDEFLAELIEEKNLKLIAVAGTHGKTTTTGLLIWAFQRLGVAVSYSIGTTISFGPSGQFDQRSQYFVYECDEFDRNMLHFSPYLTLITSLDYDHPDTYSTETDYRQAFVEFLEQSDYSLLWEKDLRYLKADLRADLEAYDELMDLSDIKLAGDHVRHNAYLVERAIRRLLDDVASTPKESAVVEAINSFPGTARRMEKLADNLYSDYGHHPVEIAATLQLARELSDHVVLVYQPHQNVRQHEIKDDYTDCMELAEDIYWLPTYLSREDPRLEILSPNQLSANLSNRDKVHMAELDGELWNSIESARQTGKLVLVMGAGSIDGWLRRQLSK
ncbi:MAG TPA: Mur ligase domain-containing protein [Candidatus Saccharimonadales bacterium]|nr:Mur ligase domain-containing protein [Candidatus Saccharimonadales bacterium]